MLGADGKTAPVTVVAGQTTENVDAGVVTLLGSLSGRYFCDDDRDGLDNDANNAVANVEVTLLGADGRPVLVGGVAVTTMTGADGSYSFSGLAAGTYGVRFGEIPAGKELTIKDVNRNGNDDIDSDAMLDRSGLPTITGISVVAGQDTPNNDAGVVEQPGSLSGRYFCDENRNDVDDAGDAAVARKTVTLFEADGTTPARDAFGNTVAPIVTEDDGTYRFEDLAARDYVVQFEDSVAEGKQFVAPDANQSGATDSANDSDVLGTDGKTAPVTVVAGQETRDVDAGVFTPNVDPTATNDSAKGCADELITVDLADNFSDPDSASVSITMVDGQAIAEGATILVDGTATLMGGGTLAFTGLEVTRSGDSFVFKGEDAFAGLDIGEEATASVSFKVEDSDGGTATASMDVTFCGDANSVQSLYDSLPATGSYQILDGRDANPFSEGGFDVKVTGTGDARLDGTIFEFAYCLDFSESFLAAGTFADAPVFSADFSGGNDPTGVLEPNQIGSANNLPAADNLDLIQYIIAQNYEADAQFNGWEVQFAIWELTNNFDSDAAFNFNPSFGQLADTDAIIADALANGEGFSPAVGQTVGMIINPNPATADNEQPYIVALDWEQYDCLC